MGITGSIFKKAVGGVKAFDNTMTKAADKVLQAPGKIIRYDESGFPIGLNKKGKAVLIGATAVGSAASAYNENERKHLGTIDSKIVSPTPDYSVYRNGSTLSAPGGADGSLVFALDKTKNGGFL